MLRIGDVLSAITAAPLLDNGVLRGQTNANPFQKFTLFV